jgi:hypothetical protein
MKNLAVIGLWLAVLVLDGTALPAFTGWPGGLGLVAFFAVFVMTFGLQRWVVGLGLALALASELILGSYFGVIMAGWLAIAWCWHGVNHFLSMGTVDENDSWPVFGLFVVWGLVLFGAGEVVMWAVARIIYQPGLSPVILFDVARSPIILVGILAELAVILLIFRLIYFSKSRPYA